MPKALTRPQKIWKAIRKTYFRALNFVKYRILHLSETMAVRHDFCRARKPQLTVIFIHGIASSYAAWADTVKKIELDPELGNVRFVGIDLIGYGHSPRPRKFAYDYASYQKILKKTIKKLRIRTPIILAGHSMGCLIAMDYALTYPERIAHLYMVSPPFFRKKEIGNIVDQFYNKVYSDLKDNTDAPLLQPLAQVISFLSSFDHKTLNTDAFRLCMSNIILNPHNWQRAFALKTKSTIVNGRFDGLVIGQNNRLVADHNRNVQFVQAMGAHDITGAKQTKVIKVLKDICVAQLLTAKK